MFASLCINCNCCCLGSNLHFLPFCIAVQYSCTRLNGSDMCSTVAQSYALFHFAEHTRLTGLCRSAAIDEFLRSWLSDLQEHKSDVLFSLVPIRLHSVQVRIGKGQAPPLAQHTVAAAGIPARGSVMCACM